MGSGSVVVVGGRGLRVARTDRPPSRSPRPVKGSMSGPVGGEETSIPSSPTTKVSLEI